MEKLQQLVTDVCIVSLIAGILRLLVPSGSLGKTAGWVISLYLLMFLLMPLGNGYELSRLIDFQPESFQVQDEDDFTKHSMEQAAVDEVTALVQSIARQQNLSVQVVAVKTRWQERQVMIEQIELAVNGTERQAQDVKRAVLASVNTTVKISLEETG